MAGADCEARSRAFCMSAERSSWVISSYSTLTSPTPGRPATFERTSVPIWPRSGQAAVVSATFTMTSPLGADPDVVDHPELDDRGPELGVEHPGQDATDVVRGRDSGSGWGVDR